MDHDIICMVLTILFVLSCRNTLPLLLRFRWFLEISRMCQVLRPWQQTPQVQMPPQWQRQQRGNCFSMDMYRMLRRYGVERDVFMRSRIVHSMMM